MMRFTIKFNGLQALSIFFLFVVINTFAQSPVGLYQVAVLPDFGFGSTANGLLFDGSTGSTIAAGSVTTAEGRQIPVGWELAENGSITSFFLPTPKGFDGEAVGVYVYDTGARGLVGNAFGPGGGTRGIIWRENALGEFEPTSLPVGGQEGEEFTGTFGNSIHHNPQDGIISITGRGRTPEGQWHAVVRTYQDGDDITITNLGETLPASVRSSTANGYTYDTLGQIVGDAQNRRKKWKPVIWEENNLGGFTPTLLPSQSRGNAIVNGMTASNLDELLAVGDVFNAKNRSRATLGCILPDIDEQRCFQDLAFPEGFSNSSAVSVAFDSLTEELIAVGSAWKRKRDNQVGAVFLPYSETALQASELLENLDPGDIIQSLNHIILTPNGPIMSGDCRT